MTMRQTLLIVPLVLLLFIAVPSAKATNESSYNQGFLQGASGAELKTHHTQDFMAGYAKGLQTYWYNRGYVEGNNKLPVSSTNVNYTAGYKGATYDLAQFGNLGKLPSSNDNYREFYLGMYQGQQFSDWQHDGHPWPPADNSCPANHTAEYCAGYNFGDTLSDYLLDQD